MTTLFISDLHLDDRRPETTALFLGFLQQEAVEADSLYILGDLFEFWLGDDAPSQVSIEVATALSLLKDRGVPCYFLHGNRDFLLHEDYAGTAGLMLLPEEHIVDLYGESVLLMHGDSLCTDDIAYQKTRAIVRDPRWQREVLAKTPEERLQVALEARDASAEHKGSVAMDIMDVNAEAVTSAFERHGVNRMIHGHTHRPAIHDLNIRSRPFQRIVLGDWYRQGSVLRVGPGGSYELAVL